MYLHSPPCSVCISWFPPDTSWCSSSDWRQLPSRWQPWSLSTNTAITPLKPVPSISLPHFSPAHCYCLVCQWFTVPQEHCISMIFLLISMEIRCKSWLLYSSLPVWRSSSLWFRSIYGRQTFTKVHRVRLPPIWVLSPKVRQHLCWWQFWSKYSHRWYMTGKKYFTGWLSLLSPSPIYSLSASRIWSVWWRSPVFRRQDISCWV